MDADQEMTQRKEQVYEDMMTGSQEEHVFRVIL